MSGEEKERQLRREMRRIERKKQERVRQLLMSGLLCVSALIILAAGIVLYKNVFQKKPIDPSTVSVPEYVDVKLLTPNEYSRPELPLVEVKGIVVHYVANPCSTALENRDYFESLKYQGGNNATSVSSHFVIGLEGEVIQCVPLNEVAYASNKRNSDTISIECCHPDEDGQFTQETYDSLLELLRWLLDVYDLDSEDVLRHYDSNGKMCPLYYVEHEDAWEQLKSEI